MKSKQLEFLRIKLAKRVADLAFLKRCRDCRLIPSFVKISHHLWSPYTKTIFSRACLSLLRSVIKSTRRAIDFLNSRLLPLHLELASSLRPDLWLRLDLTSYARASGHKEECSRRQKRKFFNLQRRQQGSHSSSPSGHCYPASSIPLQSSPSLSNPHASVFPPTPFPCPPPPPSLSVEPASSSHSSRSDPARDSSTANLSLAESAEAASLLFPHHEASMNQAQVNLDRSSTPPEDPGHLTVEIAAETVVHHVLSPQASINMAETDVSQSSILPLHSCPLQHFIKFPESTVDITVEIGDAATPLGPSFAIAQPAIHQRLLSNGSPRSTPACNLFQPRATPPLSHHQAVAREVSISCSCVQPQPALPTEEVDTSLVAYLPPRKPCPTTPLGVNSSHSLQSCPYVFSAPPPPALDLGTLPRSAPIINPISNWETKLVVNLSPAHIDPLAFNFLKRGLNFALTPRNIPHIDFLIEIENAVRTLPLDVAEEVRQDCAVALRYAKPPKFNIPKAELLAFNNLMHNNDLIISRADKGNATRMAERSQRKHRRGVEEEEHTESACKRFRGLIHTLEDIEDEPIVGDDELVCGVMKCLEQEIISCFSLVPDEDEIRSLDMEEPEDEMSYLVSASDDELGISVVDSPLSEPFSFYGGGEGSCREVWESGLWCFEDNNCSSLTPLGAECVYDLAQHTDLF
ncbi:hypothetical protein SUGI_1100970 [Cryptomeria japonica]|nr:hypothetical protein SUGI_1100970 [Cryptomeria japonica]